MSASSGGAGLDASVLLRRPGFTLDVTVTASPGEVLAVLGPNGAGKSTLLGVLAGLLHPDTGHVRVAGRTLTDPAAGVAVPAHRRGVGLLAQQALLFPHLTGLANVAFGPRAQGVARAEATRAATALLAEVDASDLATRRPGAMSGGQQQRVALARALAAGPGLLLLDEPLAALDVDSAQAMRALLRRVVRTGTAADGRTALLVTHSALDAVVMADRVVVLDAGRVVETGPVRDVLARPRSPFTARLAGLDLVAGTAERAGLRTADGTLIAATGPSTAVPGVAAVALFPPAAVAVSASRPIEATAFPARLAAVEPREDLVRLRAAAGPDGSAWVAGLAADVSPTVVADLGIEPGALVWFAPEPARVAVHPVSEPPR